MLFVRPDLLWALPLGLIPIIIYYLMRFRSLRVDWGANYVLERALERLRKKLFLDQVLLIALRVLACVALVLAFARPASTRRGGTVTGSGVHRIVVLDGSYSMLAGKPGDRRWDRAVAIVKQLASTWGRGERWSLVLLGESPRWIVEDERIDTPADIAETIQALAPEECALELGEALGPVFERAGSEPAEIYLAVDDQAATWANAVDAVPPLTSKQRLFWILPPLESTANVAIEAVRVASRRVLAGHPVRVFATVRNYGAGPVEGARVEVLVDGVFHARESVALQRGQETEIFLDVVFDKAGPHAVTARVGEDTLDYDNTGVAALEAVPAFSVLVLKDPGKKDKFASAAPILEMAADVLTRRDRAGSPLFDRGPIEVTTLTKTATPAALAKADVVVLDGGSKLDAALVSLLDEYTRAGGGLLLAADATIDPHRWNKLLGEAKILPAPLARVRVEPLGGEAFQAVSAASFESAALKAFATGEDGDLGRLRLFTWFELGPPVSGARVLARFADGSPCILAAPANENGLGRAVLLVGGLNGQGANLIVRESFYPFLFRVLSATAAGRIFPRTLARGAPARFLLPRGTELEGATFQAPGGEPVAVTPRPYGSRLLLEVPDGSRRSGEGSFLLLKKSGTARVPYGIQGPRVDSDLTPLTKAAKTALSEKWAMPVCADWRELDEVLRRSRRGAEWSHYALLALLVVLAGEMLLQRRFH